MLSKELRDVRWKLTVGALLFLVFVASGVFPYEEITRDLENLPEVGPEGSPLPFRRDPIETGMLSMWLIYSDGQIVLALLAVVLGVGLISGEASRGTIFLLLSRPLGRTRVLLTKFAVGALALFVTALLGSTGLVVFAGANGFPVSSISVAGVFLSTALAWLGSLSVLGVSLLASVVFRDVLKSTALTLLAVGLMFYFHLMNVGLEQHLDNEVMSEAPSEQLWPDFWYSESLYLGESLAFEHFLVCLVAAALPLSVALWLFHRKAY